jgi:phosphopantothenoylcysteine decarboxylase/phosphopantothenate--cysteine ligase
MAAAVADYSPVNVSGEKIKRATTGDTLEISLRVNPDIVAAVAAKAKAISQDVVIVAFAAESGSDLEALANRKLKTKVCDFIVANSISSGEVFGSDQNAVILVSESESLSFAGSKAEVATAVLENVSSKVVRTPKGEPK